LSIDGVFLLYWLFLNADRFRTKLFQPIPVAPDAIFTSIRLSWGRGSPVLMIVLNVGNMQASVFLNLCKQHLSCPETNHPIPPSSNPHRESSAWIRSHLPLSPAYKYQRPELPILGNSRPFGGPISQDKLSSKIIQ